MQQEGSLVLADQQFNQLAPLSVDEVVQQTAHVHELLSRVMHEGEHYGTIPGTQKPTLYQPGAEKLCVLFRVRPEFEVERNDLRDDHREYEVKCRLIHIPSGNAVGEGVGNCSTKESKYRYRKNAVDTGEKIPEDYRVNKAKYRKQGYGAKKIGGEWKWMHYEEGENPDIADTYNTVLKMARKRAFVDAVKTMTAASDIFTQDAEDLQVQGTVETEAPAQGPSEGGDKTEKATRQSIINEIVEILKSDCFSDDERKEFKQRARKVKTEYLWGMKRSYQEKKESRCVQRDADQVDDAHVEEEAIRAADEEVRGEVPREQDEASVEDIF